MVVVGSRSGVVVGSFSGVVGSLSGVVVLRSVVISRVVGAC